jgi:hypothetical protein
MSHDNDTDGIMPMRHAILRDWIKRMRAMKLKKLKKKDQPEEESKFSVFEIKEEED